MAGEEIMHLIWDPLARQWAGASQDPLFLAVAGGVAVGVALVILHVVHLLVRLAWNRTSDQLSRAFERGPAARAELVTMETSGRRQWIREVQRWPESIVRDGLLHRIQIADPDLQPGLALLYRDLGFVKRDLARSTRGSRAGRLLALRRLLYVATPADLPALRNRHEDPYILRIAAARVVGRVGQASDLVEFLHDLHVPRRMMEQPLLSMLQGLPDETLAGLLAAWDRIESLSVRRLLLAAGAARRLPEAAIRLPEAAKEPRFDLRIAAAQAAGAWPTPSREPLLLALARDPEWEVRAQAVRALGQQAPSARVQEALDLALGDASFWVRQNAAAGLGTLGEPGRRMLMDASQDTRDPFRADAARQELEVHALRHLAEASAR